MGLIIRLITALTSPNLQTLLIAFLYLESLRGLTSEAMQSPDAANVPPPPDSHGKHTNFALPHSSKLTTRVSAPPIGSECPALQSSTTRTRADGCFFLTFAFFPQHWLRSLFALKGKIFQVAASGTRPSPKYCKLPHFRHLRGRSYCKSYQLKLVHFWIIVNCSISNTRRVRITANRSIWSWSTAPNICRGLWGSIQGSGVHVPLASGSGYYIPTHTGLHRSGNHILYDRSPLRSKSALGVFHA